MNMKRAYSLMTVKAIDEDKREITGIASTPATDRMGDIVEPKGAEFKLPLPFLWQHDKSQPIGHVTRAKVTKEGIEITAKLVTVDEPGTLKDRLDEAWQSLKAGLVGGLSIGFSPLESARIEGTYGYRFVKWLWLELSAVTIPANAECSIQSVKAIDTTARAASGHIESTVVRVAVQPGVSGDIPKIIKGKNMNVAEQIKNYQSTRATKAAELEAIMKASADAGETLDSEQAEKHDTLTSEIKSIDTHIVRLKAYEETQKAAAVVVPSGSDPNDPVASQKAAETARSGHHAVIAVEKKLPKGVAFARLAGLIGIAKGNLFAAAEMAKNTFPEERPLHDVLKMITAIGNDPTQLTNKAAVAVGTTTATTFAAALVQYQDMASEFIDFLRPQTIIGRIPGVRSVPFNIRVPRVTNGGSAGWVGEGAPKPVTAFALDNVLLRFTKIAAIAVISQELARFSQPNADTMVRDLLAGAVIQQMDADFVDPANAGVADVKPASITNGVTAISATGTNEDAVREDIRALFAQFIASNLTPANGVWLMSPTTALSLSLMRTAIGNKSFDSISMTGGTFEGLPVVTSNAPALAGGSNGGRVILLNASDILIADDGQVTIDASDQASVQMDSAPTNPVVAATVLISLWQQNLLGLRAERFVNWVKARAQSVQVLQNVLWGT